MPKKEPKELPTFKTKVAFLAAAAKRYKVAKLRAEQRAMPDIMDDVAVALNSVATHEEEQHVAHMWGIFECLGARRE